MALVCARSCSKEVRRDRRRWGAKMRGRSWGLRDRRERWGENVEKLPDGKQGIYEKLCQVGQRQSVKPSEQESHGHKLLCVCMTVSVHTRWWRIASRNCTRVSIKASTHDWAEKWAYSTSKFQPTSSDMEREYANCASLRGFNKHVLHNGSSVKTQRSKGSYCMYCTVCDRCWY